LTQAESLKHSLPRRVLVCVVLSLVAFMACTYASLTHPASAITPGTLKGVGVSEGGVLMLLRNGTVCEARIKGFTAFSALPVNESVAVAFGTFNGHPALLMLVTGQNRVPHAVLYYVLGDAGALFSGIVGGRQDIVGVGYVALNNTYAGIVTRVNLGEESASAFTYVFNVPTYFRDVIIHSNEVVVAAGAGFGGRYYPAVALISGSDARLIALSPRIGGLHGFAVKAAVIPRGDKPAVLTMRGEEAVLISLTSKGFHAYVLVPGKEFEDVGLVAHPSEGETIVILKGTTPLAVTFPYMSAYLLPLASHYYLVTANRTFLVLGPGYKVLALRGKPFKLKLSTLSLEGFDTVEYIARGKHVNVTISKTPVFVKVISSSTHTIPQSTPQSTTPPSTSLSSQAGTAHTSARIPGFTLISGGGGNGLLLIAVGCALIFASFLLKRLLGV